MRLTEESRRPNFLVIVADDLGIPDKEFSLIVGYSDTSPYGSEITTPAIQKLSDEGVRLTQFHTASACSPTRSMLLSGTDNHIAGLGQMAEFLGPLKGNPGYEGFLNDRVAALPAVLKEAGYTTLISGKWHLGTTKEQCPSAKGFDKVFSLLQGGGNHYRIVLDTKGPSVGKDAVFRSTYDVGKDQPFKTLADLPDNFYSSDYYANKLIEFIDQSPKSKPFFAYLPFTAPHWPLQAPPEITKKYEGKYDDGPAELRARRLAAQVKLGLLDDGVEPYPLTGGKEWDEMSEDERKYSAKTMEVYAAMVESMDYNIGKVVKYLESTGQLDNTFIVFHSDNGAEGAVLEALPVIGPAFKRSIEEHYDNSYENIGAPNSWCWYGPRWAQAATAPSRMNKGYITQGGIRCPAIVRYPPAFAAGQISHEFTTVMDIYPTILALARVAPPPGKFQGRAVVPIRGQSWVKYFQGKQSRIYGETSFTGWELFGQQAVRQGKWKALFIPPPLGKGEWELFDLDKDPGEIHDLTRVEKDKLEEMIGLWEQYENDAGVLLSPDIPRFN